MIHEISSIHRNNNELCQLQTKKGYLFRWWSSTQAWLGLYLKIYKKNFKIINRDFFFSRLKFKN